MEHENNRQEGDEEESTEGDKEETEQENIDIN